MVMIDVSRQRRSLLSDATALDHLPSELLEIVKDQSSTKLFDAISEAALNPSLTEPIFVHFEDVFSDICARWILSAGNGSRRLLVVSAIARILPFAPYLSTFLQCPGKNGGGGGGAGEQPPPLHLLLPQLDGASSELGQDSLLQSLLTYWRLLSFDVRTFSSLISPAYMQSLFTHESRAVRYLAIRLFCQLFHASDHKLEALIEAHVGNKDAIIADFDGAQVDYGFLSLHERARAKKVIALRQRVKRDNQDSDSQPCPQTLTPYVVSYGEIILPRPTVPISDPSSLVMTATTTRNLEQLAASLRNPEPILLHGLPGVGKTALVHEIAKQLGMYSSMVTLHLNEQTDAKMLIGLYSTDSKPGSFSWRPGVLTTAVKEGRWVLVEDLDRAPTEVLSTFLPLIERNELLIPSRGERIRAANSFRLFATVRTSRGMNGRENLPSIVGMRFWQSLYTEPQVQLELEEVVLQTYPILKKFLPGILAVYGRLSRLSSNPGLLSRGRSIVDRQMSLRDLLKWCRRLKECLLAAGSITGEEPISETTRDWMFMEAIDCFVGSCPDEELSKQLVYAIAEEMHLSKERADHYVTANIPPLEENDVQFSIGRVQLRKKKLNRLQKSKRPFASTTHAKRLLEQIAVAVKLNEPVLLVGETGIGKTAVVQQLAESLGHKLIAVNLSQQSEVGDLLGGFKPVNVRSLAIPLKEEFEDLFSATGISASKNQKYLEQVGKTVAKGQWSKLCKLWKEAPKMFLKIVSELERAHSEQAEVRNGDAQPTKRRKTQSKLQTLLELKPRWDLFARNLQQFEIQITGSSNFAFSFVEGNLVKAVRNGDWVLLDEINLASPDTLESVADLLTGPSETPSILLSETGEIEKIVAHPNFRIFGAMNPATDIGKRDLPIGIRSRFTELYVKSPDKDLKDLLTIIKTYLGNGSRQHDQAADDIARLYLNTKRMAEERRLVDGANEVPHFSLRTLTRVLSYVNTISPSYGVRRALYEGFSMGFLTLLNGDSEKMLLPLIYHHLLDKHGNPQALLSQPPKHPGDGRQYVKFQNQSRDRQYWLFQGDQTPIERDDYIITPYVERNLLNLVRATSTRRFPILIQGPTSAGKTSMIEYLANFTGNKFVRINNHEHTDLQEYLGTYISGADGKLRFQEGLLVQAMRQGHWIVLDELNLAPTDVLEALNRLLDDNRELLIPETQEVVKPHENFILFATQNPAGLYGGRKVLSRAFRNRFLELHFDDIPEDELEYILQQRSRNTSPPDCRRIVTVYKELSRLRQTSRLFEQKDSFATLRDLFRWALRDADTREEIAAHGFMLLAERVRNEEERIAVKEVIEKVFKTNLDPQELYSADLAPELKQFTRQTNDQGVVWTHAMRRLYVLVSRALRNNEPVLLVGETGCGKTTVVQLLAEALKKELNIVNAHQNTETGDLIGSQRPIRNRGAILEALDIDVTEALKRLDVDTTGSATDRLERYKSIDSSILDTLPLELRERMVSNETRSKALFEWSDGALVEAMRSGHFFLLDEISLADDSVLERLNSVLEPQRTLLLAEKGVDNSFVKGSDGFQFFATMNPGGDFGKKELSPALRNRFTEIWVPPLSGSDDIYDIVREKLDKSAKAHVKAMVQFAAWFGEIFRPMATTPFSVREVLAWVQFINAFPESDPIISIVHGAAAIFVDSLGANPSAILATDINAIQNQRQDCLNKLGELLGRDVSSVYQMQPELAMSDSSLTIGDFSTPRTPEASSASGFAFHAPTTRLNAMRVVRAMQTSKPILLEGSPGVGKTSLVVALAQACGKPLTRINLSDQTDLMDLFGTDVPVEGEEAGNFAWRDAPFLQAMQKGEWVLLDEMNLASQSVLEGLNACLDHRGEVYISELDQVFKRHPNFRLFAAQNPHHQGGGRKGLPASFVNRFIVVYADVFKDDDLKLIAGHSFPQLSEEVISSLIKFVSQIDHHLAVEKSFGAQGGPWEFNLRDVLRWLNMLSSSDPVLQTRRVDDFLDIVVRQRFRTEKDRAEVDKLYRQTIGSQPRDRHFYHDISSRFGQVGLALLARDLNTQPERLPNIDIISRLPELESMMLCVKQNIPCILSSPSGYGKSVLLEYVAALAGKPLVVFPMNADIDTMDLVGGFEQADPLREINQTLRNLRDFLQVSVMSLVPTQAPDQVLQLLHQLDAYNGDSDNIAAIRISIESLLSQVAEDSEVGVTLSKALVTLQSPLVLANPRFEWLDGVIVKALETGQWLVLDNANMCNASVLDRLNSLLEPNGFLSINEHCGPNGEPRVVRPHPEFRIFLTMDPRYGELSRAMRNRAIEIHLYTPPPVMERCLGKVSDIESSLQRYLKSTEHSESLLSSDVSVEACQVSLENLSVEDISLLPRFANILSSETRSYQKLVQEFLQFFQSPAGSNILQALFQLYSKLPGGSSGLSNAQPLHTLNNFTVSNALPYADEARWDAICYETYRHLYGIQQTLDQQRNQARAAKLMSLNRLQRSLISDRVAAVSKDSTVRLAAFVSAVLNAMAEYLNFNLPLFDDWEERTHFVRIITCYLDRTLSLSTQGDFDEAVFQAHLAQGTALLKKQIEAAEHDHNRQFGSHILQTLHDDFTSGFKLTTGLSMELLWSVLRPSPLPNKSVFDRSLELDRLGDRFDNLRWKAGASISDLSKAQQTLEQAYKIVRDGVITADGLVKDLTAGIESLEARIGDEESELLPFFANEFEALRQFAMLRSMASKSVTEGAQDLSILSNVPTKARLVLASSFGRSEALQSMDCLVHQGRFPWDGKLAASLWHKLQTMGGVSLGSLALLDMELPAMGRHLTSLSADLATDPLKKLNKILGQLIVEVFGAHGQHLKTAAIAAFNNATQQFDSISSFVVSGQASSIQVFNDFLQVLEPPHLQQVAVDHLIPSIVALLAAKKDIAHRTSFSSLAWTHFSIGVLKLYVPDRVFDPQLRPKMEREYFLELQTRLTDKISALVAFENQFTGQSTNERIELLSQELSRLGPLPEEVQPVFRPEFSELSRLHAEFANILKAITSPGLQSALQPASSPSVDKEGLSLVRENVKRLLDRLSSRFEAYQDMTRPAANLLQCLLIGLSLYDAANAKHLLPATEGALQMIPFLGGSSWDISIAKSAEKSFEFLNLMHTAVAVEVDRLPSNAWEPIFECFHGFYDDWKRKLEEDRKAEEEKTSLYHFRGSFEDEEEIDEQQFNELFPSYDGEDQAVRLGPKRDQVRNMSLKVAQAHKKLFFDKSDPAMAIQELCKAMSNRIVGETRDHANIDRELNSKMLAGTMLLLDEKLDGLQPSALDKSYNFYTDANLSEARQLVTVVNKIKARFQELQQVDEIGHMQPLADVVQSCNKVLELVHEDPLAMILPKVEQLHAFVYEWQFGGWASKTYAVLPLHNSITDTIIRWRRLELSTWANLFDMEQQKCQEDAYSWWFIAYQVVIAAPLSMVDSESELREYAISLIRTLEQYFSGSIVGQFRTRVALLKQFQNHLKLLVKDYPTLSVIHDALTNFVGYFARYEKEADAAIQRGRTPLEKKMKDVLLMASWKDTNINALRESAKKSHLKLFRIVRKFRSILGQEMKTLISQGLPNEELFQGTQNGIVSVTANVPKEAFASLNQALPGWLDNHKRLANVSKTVSVMQKVSESPELTSGAAKTLDDFVSSLDTSMAELRKETPSTLTDENKEQVKHLKTRKRKLFADTLRDLRNMGLRYNLGQDKLAEQESLSIVLASVAPLELSDAGALKDSEYYFHKILDLVPKTRLAAREHSEELTGAEVARSIGFVEGLIHFILSQRSSLSSVGGTLKSLQEVIGQFRELGNFQTLGNLTCRTASNNLSRLLPWAAQGLKFAIQLVQVHGKLGQFDHSALVQKLQSWMSKVESHSSKLGAFAKVSQHFIADTQAKLEQEISQDLQSLQQTVEDAIQENPGLAFILQQLRVWTQVSFEQSEAQPPTADLVNFTDAVSTLCDTALVAVESARKAGAGVLIKEDEAGWLKKHNDAYFAMINQLHMKNVEKSIEKCMRTLQKVDLQQPQNSIAAMSTISVASPILDQFSALCQQSIMSSLDMHRATVQMAYNMTKAFTTIASQGFCTPQEKSDEKSGDSGKVETGTGLGDGEGAEDISKDIQPDEDLSELAQEANKEKNEDVEDEKDAVDMADEDMEGEMGSVAGDDDEEDDKKGDEEEEEEKEMDEEAGDVDDLDPTAVDEKMWDGNDDEKAEKDQKGEKEKGQKQDDEQMATEGEAKPEDAEKEPEANQADEPEPQAEDAGDEEEDVQAQEELNRQDQNVQENDALELPEDLDMNMDEPEDAGSEDDDLDLMSDIEEENEQEEQPNAAEADEEEDMTNANQQLEEEAPADEEEITSEPEEVEDKIGADEIQDEIEPEQEEQGEEPKEDEEAEQKPLQRDETKADTENAAPSDVKSAGQDQNADSMDLDDQFQANAAEQEDGEMGEAAADQDTSAGNKGATSRSKEPVNKPEKDEDAPEEARNDPFKKLGDALERWHRQQQDIKDANQDDENQPQGEEPDADQGRKEFQHLQDDNAAEDTQALGTADNEEAQPLDESMAIDEEKEDPTSRLMDGDKDEPEDQEADQMDVEQAEDKEAGVNDMDNTRTGVQTRQGNYDRESTPSEEEAQKAENEAEEEEIQDASAQLSTTHIWDEQRPLRDFSECMHQWSEFQTKSHSLSLSLTSQLRLILTPSQSTKLSGSFRTGKRLNIKRIIPYIASSYKRDKIWMRRAIPTKRTYQIMLCVDDSKSMGESSSGTLAMESLVMVSRSLTMLEAGQVGVMGFGADVFTAHQLTDPFASDAGAKVLQKFSFSQDRTDVALLIRQTIDTFRAARQQSSGGSDLWQLALILSDGLTPSTTHEPIRRLLREATEERIMIVFIIMDDTGKKKGNSVLELKEAKFIKDGAESRVVIERYLDTFPFQYYLIVHNLEELPSALAGLLRTWFAEVSS
ncbi:Midasin [Cladobotryum mycophilum]|uniref:Midasin n=1 Tax=Cladobotryum mycophilum TaxID=491253 RepID=A0ABR0SD17_9HYPO